MDHKGHNHASREQEIACALLHTLAQRTGLAGAVVIVEESRGEGRASVTSRGNITDMALMVRGMLELVARAGRPTDCLACMENFDALMRAREAMARIVGSC